MATTQVGLRIKNLRENRKITFEELSRRTGLPVDFLKQLENQDLYPSIGPLLKVSRALGTRLGTLLDDQVSADPVVVRKGDRHEELNMLTGKDQPVTFRYHSLARGKADRHMEPFFIEIAPESEADKKPSSHEGEEWIMVTGGELQVTYGEKVIRLKEGDSVYFNSVVPHNVCSVGGKAEIIACLYIPS